jgi:non-ribosomal peptide synthetase-like protein
VLIYVIVIRKESIMPTRTDELNETGSHSHIGSPYTHITQPIKYMSNFFEQTCLLYPKNIAVICGSYQLTYSQLDRRANRLARLLLQYGLTEGQTVGIYMERSVNTYIALLAVLKAGGAFVPLDPSFPADRVAFIAEDANLQYLLTTTAMRERTQGLPCRLIEIDQATEVLVTQPSTDPYIRVSPTSLCYIIYTSGTTGRPKGVAISHANIANFLRVVPSIYGVKPTDRVYQGMSTAFDFSVEEIWPTWIRGATLVAGPTDSRRLGQGLTEFLIEHKITILYCVPTLLATIEQDVPSVRTLLVGGEACPPDLVRRWYRPKRRILNTYGPTETTVTATWCELYPDRPVTIGVPLPTYHVYILDEQLRPVKRGESGEICIGGPGVGLGYVNRPDLTSSKFIDNPILSEREVAPRLYRSGDLGCFTTSGEIEYLGRIDTQVKIRGYRIELSEIEAVIREDVAVENAVVSPLMQHGVVQDLTAYITLNSRAAQTDEDELRDRLYTSLRSRLPVYMVPAYIEVLKSFPLLAADKVNRNALPEPTSQRLGVRSGSYVAPTTAMQSRIVAIWEQALGQQRISIEADFFTELGGHSLAAARVISQMRQEPNLQGLSIGDLYANPTIRRLALFIERNMLPSAAAHAHVRKAAKPAPQKHSNWRVLGCGLAQLLTEYGMALLLGIPILGLPMALQSWNIAIPLIIATFLFLSISSLLLPVVVGRLLLANVRPGWYPLWGVTYLRWWLYRKLLALAPVGLLTGSPLLSPYLRLLGARVGRHCHFASGMVNLPMFLDIEDNVSIGYGVQLQPYSVEDGRLRIAPIHIGRGTFVGTNSVIMAGARIGSGAIITEQSLVSADQIIPSNEFWGGSPSERLQSVRNLLKFMASRPDHSRWPISVLGGFLVGTIFLTLLPILMLLPSIALIAWVTLYIGLYWGLASTVVAGPLFVFSVCTLVLVSKKLITPKVQPGVYPLRSGFGLRKWLSDHIMALSLGLTNTLYATLYLVPFLRMLGARIGRWSEVSTVGHIDPEMLILGDESFVADIAVVGPAVFYHGYVAMAPVEVGGRSFVGNAAIVPVGSRIGGNSLLGVHSVPASRQLESKTSWLGSPAIFLPRRQESLQFNEDLTYCPRPGLVAWRLFIEYIRITLPATIMAFTSLVAIVLTVDLTAVLSPLALWQLLPSLLIGIGIASTLLVVLLKWLIVGKYRPRVEPLWSVFVRRSELVTGLYEAVAVPALLSWLTGTPWIAPVMRLFGIKIGKRVWMDTTFITEFDLVEIGDDAAIGGSTSLQTHLFEDRVMKMSTVKIGAGASVGSRAVVLYDAEVGAGASLGALSLVMKGESLPAESQWIGIPARASH